MGVAGIGEQKVASIGIPHPGGFIPAAGNDIRAIGRPCHAVDLAGMSLLIEYATSRSYVPDLHGAIGVTGGDTRAAG